MIIKLDTRLGWLNMGVILFNQLSVGTSNLEFKITENNECKDLSGIRVMIEIKTPGGSIQEEHVTVINATQGVVEKDLSAPMLTEVGIHYGELSLYSQGNTKLLCTQKFRYIVGSNYAEESAKQSSQYATLQECIFRVDGLEERVGNNIEEIEKARHLAELAQNEAEASKNESMISASNSIQSSIASERSAESAQTSEQSATDSATQALTAEQSANKSKVILEEKVLEVSEIKGKVDEALETANTSLAQANTAIHKAETLTDKNENLILVATQTTSRAEDAIKKSTEANNVANQKLIETTTQADRAEQAADRSSEAAIVETKKHVTLNGSTQTNFDFIEGKVVQDGLEFSDIKTYDRTLFVPVNLPKSEHYIYFKCYTTDVSNGWFISDTNGRFRVGYGNGMFMAQVGAQLFKTKVTAKPNVEYTIMYSIHQNKVIFNCDGNEEIFDNTMGEINIGNVYMLGYWDGSSYAKGYIKTPFIYNRRLTPQEIQHNFSVLNNSQSISQLQTTDSTGKTSISYAIGSDEDHVEMSTGRTLRQEYMGLLKRDGKEFTADASGKIDVQNGLEARMISAEIKGQTVKEVVGAGDFSKGVQGWSGIGNFAGVIDGDTYIQTSNGTNPHKIRKLIPRNTFIKNNKYYISAEVSCLGISGTTSLTVYTKDFNTIGRAQKSITGSNFIRVSALMDYTSTVTDDSEQYIQVDIQEPSTTGTIMKVKNIVILDVTGTTQTVEYYDSLISKAIPFGLNSTQAIISNNGMKYPFYEPTIQGKTRILKALKGTQNWVEIDASETRDTATYDYKLDSGGGNLGSTPNSTDYIDRTRKVKIINTFEKILDGSEIWHLHTTGEAYQSFYFTEQNKTASSGIYSNLAVKSWASAPSIASEFLWYDNGKLIGVVLSKTKASTAEQFKAYLAQQKTNGTPITVRYQLATPQEIQLTDEQLKTYDAYKKLISLGGVGDMYDVLGIKEDGNGIWLQNTKGIVYNGTEGWSLYRTNENTVCFSNGSQSDAINGANKSNRTTLNTYFSRSGSVIFDQEGWGWGDNGTTYYMCILKSKLATPDAQGFKTWLASNPITVRYQLATPIVAPIPKELIQPIQTNQINILEIDSAVKPSSFKAIVPVDRIAELQSEMQEFKKQLGAVAALQLDQIK